MRLPAIFVFIVCFQNSHAQPISIDSMLVRLEKNIEQKIGSKIDSFQGKTTDGSSISNANLKNKITLLCFWFASCKPCILEIPVLNKLAAKYKRYKNFQLLGITFESEKNCKLIIKKYNIQYPTASLSQLKCDSLHFYFGYPTLMLIDTMGLIRHIIVGAADNSEIITEELNKSLIPKVEKLLIRNKK